MLDFEHHKNRERRLDETHINRNLAVLVIQKLRNVVAAFLEDLLAEEHCGRSSIDKEVIVRNIIAISNVLPPIVPKVEDTRLNSQPSKISC